MTTVTWSQHWHQGISNCQQLVQTGIIDKLIRLWRPCSKPKAVFKSMKYTTKIDPQTQNRCPKAANLFVIPKSTWRCLRQHWNPISLAHWNQISSPVLSLWRYEHLRNLVSLISDTSVHHPDCVVDNRVTEALVHLPWTRFVDTSSNELTAGR